MTDEELAAKAAADQLNQGKTAEELAAEAIKNNGTGAENEKSLFERLQDANKPAEPAIASQNQESRIPAEVAERLSKIGEYETAAKDAQTKLKAYEENAFIQAINYGADETKLRQIAKEIAGEDYSKYPYSELLKLKYEKKGLKGDNLQSAVTAKLAEYDSIEDTESWKKTLMETELRDEFPAGGGESATLKQLKELAAKNQSAQQAGIPTEQEKSAVIAQDMQSIESAITEFKNIGIEINQERIKGFYNEKNITPYLDANDRLNAKQMVFDRYVLDNIENIIKSEREAAVKDYLKKDAGIRDPRNDTGTASGKQPDQRNQHLVNMGMNPALLNQKPIIIND